MEEAQSTEESAKETTEESAWCSGSHSLSEQLVTLHNVVEDEISRQTLPAAFQHI